MNNYESIEYYSSCPSCGASNNGRQVCEYCGSLLVRKTVREVNGTGGMGQEAFFAMQDAEYPVVNGVNCEKSNSTAIICIIFGIIFLLVPIGIAIPFALLGAMNAIIAGALVVFGLIGLVPFFILGAISKKRNICKNSPIIAGQVRGYESSNVYLNGNPVLRVKILINPQTNPKIVVMNTNSTRRIYGIGQMLNIRNYEDYYMIER